MPARTYMVVDPRRDHRFGIPRPDLSEKLNVPNACNTCHKDKSIQWAVGYFNKWYGAPKNGNENFGEIFYAARKNEPGARDGLIRLIEDRGQSTIVRATALSLLENYPNPAALQTIRAGLGDPDPLMRSASVGALNFLPPENRVPLLSPLLNDSVLAVRVRAARMLAAAPRDQFSPETLIPLESALLEYEQTQWINSDHPSAHLNLGNFYLDRGDFGAAEAAYRKAIELEPGYLLAYINLTDLYRAQDRDADGERILRRALEIDANYAPANYTLGLLLIRRQEKEKALAYLRRAANLSPENPRYSYVYGIALNTLGKPAQAIAALEKALKSNPFDRDLLFSLAAIYRDRGALKMAREYAKKLTAYYPENSNYRMLEQQLENR